MARYPYLFGDGWLEDYLDEKRSNGVMIVVKRKVIYIKRNIT